MSAEISNFIMAGQGKEYPQRMKAARVSKEILPEINEVEKTHPEERVLAVSEETTERPENNVLKTRKGKIRQWSELAYHLPEDRNPHHERFLEGYFNAQLKISRGQKVRAREIFDGLVKKKGYREFEENNQALLAAIDIVVRGETNRKPIGGPGFRVKKS